jgi:Tfp pilus assembly protein PilF
MKRLVTASLLIFVAAAGFAAPGRITGQIVDPAGEPIPEATVTVRARDVEMVRSAESDKKGRYTVQIVDATRQFDITIEKEGYLPIEQPIKPVVGGVLHQNYVLEPKAAAAVGPNEQEMAHLKSRNEAAKTYNEGAEAYEKGDLETAAARFREAAELQPDLAVAWAALARAELERSEWASARAAAQKVHELSPGEPLGLRMEYDALVGAGMRAEADAVLEVMATEVPETAAVLYYNVGVAAVKEKDWAKAKRSFTRTIETDPSIDLAYLTVSQIEINLGEYAAALAHAQHYLEAKPDEPRGLQVVFNAYRGLGEAEKAEAAYARLREQSPETLAQGLMLEGTANFNNGDVAAAKDLFERVLMAQPDHPKAHFMLGRTYTAMGDYAKAKAEFRRFLELAPDDPEAELAKAMLEGL